MIGGLPLLQALFITITGKPIPFATGGKFPPESIRKIVANIKEAIKNGKDALNRIKDSFHNFVNEHIDKPLAAAVTRLEEITKDNFAGLQKALPGLFSKTGGVATARENLLSRIGSVAAYANDPNHKILGMNLSDWSMLGNTLYDSVQTFKNHTNTISGVKTDDKYLKLDTVYGNILVSNGTVNVSSGSNVAYANLSQSQYPSINVGDTLTINTQSITVIGLEYSIASGGTVSVTSNDYNVVTSSVSTLNLASVFLGGSTTLLTTDMYIKVNNEIKQIESINATGDYLTVYSQFRENNSSAALYTEIGFVANVNFADTSTDSFLYKNTAFCANSECLGSIIYGEGTTFTSNISVGNKIYYDELEFNVISITDTQIEVDAPLRLLTNEIVYKVIDEQAVFKITDSMSPDEILGTFDAASTMTTGFGENYIDGLSTRFRAANGEYMQVDAYKPTHVTQSLQKPDLPRAASRAIQSLLDNLQNDAIKYLSDAELIVVLERITDEIDAVKNRVLDAVYADLAAFNALKGLLQALLKLFMISCSKKKKGNDPEPTSSDDYLALITIPNATRQGCQATVSDIIDLLDAADAEYKTVELPAVDINPTIVDPTDLNDLIDLDAAQFVPERDQIPGDLGDIELDGDPEESLPVKIVDPCTQPC